MAAKSSNKPRKAVFGGLTDARPGTISAAMDGTQTPSAAAISFASTDQAARLIAGVPAAARLAREAAEAGFERVWIGLPAGESLPAAVLAEIRRLAGNAEIRVGSPPAGEQAAVLPAEMLIPAPAIGSYLAGGLPESAIPLDRRGSGAEILRRTGKAADGFVSRWLNRPVSRRLSALVLLIPGFRPLHATMGTAALALAMFAALVFGGPAGIVAGGLLFQAASVFDGVDGEVARATFRSSRFGAALDTAVDTAASVLLIVGLVINLALDGRGDAVRFGVWGLSLFILGLLLIAWHAVRTRGPFSFNRIKRHYSGAPNPLAARVIAFFTFVTGRDFYALLFAVLMAAGLGTAVIYLFAAAASIWVLFVAGSVLPRRAVSEA